MVAYVSKKRKFVADRTDGREDTSGTAKGVASWSNNKNVMA